MYTYRYSKEQSAQVSWVCPICYVKKTIEYEGDIRHRDVVCFTIANLCCSIEHTKEYEKRIKQAIKWGRNAKSTRLSREDSRQVYHQHYNAISIKGASKYTSLARVLANLSEYFPFNPKGGK